MNPSISSGDKCRSFPSFNFIIIILSLDFTFNEVKFSICRRVAFKDNYCYLIFMEKNNSTQPFTESDLTEAKDLDQRLTDAFSRKDLDAAMACFWNNPDLLVVLNGTVHRGPDAVRTSIIEMFEQNESIRVGVDEVTHILSGDGIIGVGTATFDMKPADGSRRLMVERWTDLRKKIDGQWVYVHDHTTIVPE